MLAALFAFLFVWFTGFAFIGSLVFMTAWVTANLMKTTPLWCDFLGVKKTEKTSTGTTVALIVAAALATATGTALLHIEAILALILK